jgi:hypothetical protein
MDSKVLHDDIEAATKGIEELANSDDVKAIAN